MRPLLALLLALVAAAPAQAKTLVRAKVDLGVKGPTVPPNFVGVSHEFTAMRSEILNPQGPNPVFAQLLRGLGEAQGSPAVLRLGGGSTEATWWNPRNEPFPPGFYFNLTPQNMTALRDLLAQADARVIFGLNMADPDPAVAVDEARVVQAAFGDRLLAYELGNEPGGFPEFTRYTDEQGTEHPFRPQGWGPDDYASEVTTFTRALNAAGITGRVAAAATDPRPEWIRALPRIDRASEAAQRLVTVHEYPMTVCDSSPVQATRERLLNKGSTLGSAVRVRDAVRTVRKAGRSTAVRVSESNSASCGGIPGGSNTFAAALWGIDELFGFAAGGASGADFHASSERYAPFVFGRDEQGWFGRVQPLYFAQRIFAEATADGGRILPSVHLGQRWRPGATIQLWGVHHRDTRTVDIVAVYRQGPGRGTVQVTVPRGAKVARLRRLTAPHVYAPGGVSWAGRSFPQITRDGVLQGTERSSAVRRGKRSRYRFRMTPASAAVLRIQLKR